MLQTLLADRFQFRMHRETKASACVLSVARGGAKLTRSNDGDCIARDPAKPTPPLAPRPRRDAAAVLRQQQPDITRRCPKHDVDCGAG